MYGKKADNLKILSERGINVPLFSVINGKDAGDDNCLNAFIQNTVKSIGDGPYAVRSSANAEDGNDTSFAGIFETYLNVEESRLGDCIKQCIAALSSQNAKAYEENMAGELPDAQMNVIVQKMVCSELSGVLFTANPQGILNESTVVVGKGLGEGVVSDTTETTTYYYNNTDGNYFYDGNENLLSEEQLISLIEISGKIKEIMQNEYLDIEFAIEKGRIYILQTRAITTLSDENPLILDNSNIVESYPGISLPLTVSFVKTVYCGVFSGLSARILRNGKQLDRYRPVFSQMVGNANGRLYYKISNWYTVIKFLPFNKKIIPVWQEMLGVRNKNYDGAKVKLPAFVRVMTYFNAVYELLTVQRHMTKLEKTFRGVRDDFLERFPLVKTPEEVWELYDMVAKRLLACWDITLINDLYAFIYTGLYKASLKKKYEDYEKRANDCISGITNLESMRPVNAMITLAYRRKNMTKEEYDKAFDDYIAKFGDRNLEELKLESKTFRTNPELLTAKLDALSSDEERLSQMYEDICKTPESSKKSKGFLLKHCQKGIKSREISRLNRSRIFGMVRSMMLKLGEIYADEGLLNSKEDVFWVTLEELRDMCANPVDMRETVSRRKEEYKVYAKLPAYTRLIFEGDEFDRHPVRPMGIEHIREDNKLSGIPCSGGKVTAEALVINDINNIPDVTGKILITKMTDPGWVFLLVNAAGIISEKGSLLSHTAIISRELKLPSVVGVPGLLECVHTGDIVSLNADTGEIEVKERKKDK